MAETSLTTYHHKLGSLMVWLFDNQPQYLEKFALVKMRKANDIDNKRLKDSDAKKEKKKE